PILQGNMQFVGRTKKLPPGFSQKSREFFLANFDRSLKIIRDAEDAVPKKWWIPLPADQRDEYNVQTRKVRVALRD
ncbi:hypothetical protein ACPXAZ_26050, partial [Escherichia coli]|uniref:hypothetical protein n=1 Tax=Escherichia coli TaxID=562 RepID=UPI003CE4747B